MWLMYDFAKNKISLAIIAFLKFCFLAVSELSYKQDLQHGCDKGWMREQVCASYQSYLWNHAASHHTQSYVNSLQKETTNWN
jgi:hypothetical protein